MNICIRTHMHTYIHTYIYIYIYIHTNMGLTLEPVALLLAPDRPPNGRDRLIIYVYIYIYRERERVRYAYM